MSEGDSNKSGVSSALLSIASAYSDSESSEEPTEDNSKSSRTTLGSLVENLRAEAQETIAKTSSSPKPEVAVTSEEPEDVCAKPESPESDKQQSALTKIVRLGSGKVVKISTSPNKSESQDTCKLEEVIAEFQEKNLEEESGNSEADPPKIEECVETIKKIDQNISTMGNSSSSNENKTLLSDSKDDSFEDSKNDVTINDSYEDDKVDAVISDSFEDAVNGESDHQVVEVPVQDQDTGSQIESEDKEEVKEPAQRPEIEATTEETPIIAEDNNSTSAVTESLLDVSSEKTETVVDVTDVQNEHNRESRTDKTEPPNDAVKDNAEGNRVVNVELQAEVVKEDDEVSKESKNGVQAEDNVAGQQAAEESSSEKAKEIEEIAETVPEVVTVSENQTMELQESTDPASETNVESVKESDNDNDKLLKNSTEKSEVVGSDKNVTEHKNDAEKMVINEETKPAPVETVEKETVRVDKPIPMETEKISEEKEKTSVKIIIKPTSVETEKIPVEKENTSVKVVEPISVEKEKTSVKVIKPTPVETEKISLEKESTSVKVSKPTPVETEKISVEKEKSSVKVDKDIKKDLIIENVGKPSLPVKEDKPIVELKKTTSVKVVKDVKKEQTVEKIDKPPLSVKEDKPAVESKEKSSVKIDKDVKKEQIIENVAKPSLPVKPTIESSSKSEIKQVVKESEPQKEIKIVLTKQSQESIAEKTSTKETEKEVITLDNDDSMEEIEIISSSIKTDSSSKKGPEKPQTVNKPAQPTTPKPLPKLERIKIRPPLNRGDSGAKKVESAKVQTSSSSVRQAEQPTQKKVPSTAPIKLKRNFGDSDGSDPNKRLKQDVPKPQYSSSQEIRDILAKRLGSGLDISIIPKSKPETSVTIGDIEIIARGPQTQPIKSPPLKSEPMKSPPRIQIPATTRPQLNTTTPYQQKLAQAQQSYQASFTNMINATQNRLPAQQQQKKSPQTSPQQILQQHLQQQQQQIQQQQRLSSPPHQQPPKSAKDNANQVKSPPPEVKRTVPLIIRRNETTKRMESTTEVPDSSKIEETNKVPSVRVSLRDQHGSNTGTAKIIRPSEISTDSSCSSGSELQPSTVQLDSSSSSQENTDMMDENIDFENIIGTSVVCKETGLPARPEVFGEKGINISPSIDTSKIQQPSIILEPIETPIISTPRKRGRPRKSTQQAMNATPIIWEDGGDETTDKDGKPLGRAERRRRREAVKTVQAKRRREEAIAYEEARRKGGDGEDGTEDETPKKRFIPRPPLKKKRRRGVYSVKRRPLTPKKNHSEKENVQNFEEETRMSASEIPSTPSSSRHVTGGDESQGSSVTTEGQASRSINKKGRMEVMAESCKPVTVQQIVEYYWPPLSSLNPGEKQEGLMIQEQITEYLGVKSFKRKYPSIKRRPVEMEERNYLQENGFVSENMCDMGLTAVYAADIIEIMFNDFPHKFEEFRKYSREKKIREQKALREKQAAERADADPKKEAMEAAFSWNNEFNKARRFKVVHIDPKMRFLTEGTPVAPFTRVAILHAPVYKTLCVESNFWDDSLFSAECEISVHTLTDFNKRITAPNIWMFLVGSAK